ncbi:ArsR family transcriptional regulator [Streptomyces sp. N2-109]|uniref:ArsR family transcriptional regulator n=1 Tax=Streptomyces gossypii TaxID=2883101 RepID=A0ABT2JLA3_9ACTN|nr:ArsR family transcriptional regulator [Streptomyces gossypii]MCT2588651.1 ArsR family transcriptional regulator [Streptomyces gossypii]
MTGAGRERERPRRRQVSDTLRDAESPLGVADVAGRLGIHVNTARFHLDALAAEGAVERTLEGPAGPGRPRTVYSLRPGMDRSGIRSYRLLAQILLSQLSTAGSGAQEAAERTGREWGGFLVDQPPPFQRLTGEAATARLIALLTDLGFAPEPQGGAPVPEAIRLRHCPFLELAEEHGSIVCSIHLGLMQGALTQMRAPVAAARLKPFAEPDVCLAHLEHLEHPERADTT